MKSIYSKKTLILIILLFGLSQISGQIGISTTVINGSGLLDFPSGTTNGIILPSVAALPASPSNGTFLADSNDGAVKMYINGSWQNLSDTGNITAPSGGDRVNNGVIMGAGTSTATGVLVLESSDKALILPKITDPHLNVKNPVAGMISYDTTSKSLAIFDGVKWSYWR